MTRPAYLDEHRSARPGSAGPCRQPRPSTVGTATGTVPGTAQAAGLRVDPDGRLSEILIPSTDAGAAMGAHLSTARTDGLDVSVGVEVLDADLVMWFDEDGADNGVHNPAASVVVAMFGRPGAIYGPVVFTGRVQPKPGVPAGAVDDVSVAATILLAGVVPTCDLGTVTVDRAAEFARLDIDIVVPAPRVAGEALGPRPTLDEERTPGAHRTAAEPDLEVSFDAQANTVTVDGDVARCAECDQEAAGFGHPEHQPDVLVQR